MNIKAHLILPNSKDLMKSVGLNEGGKVQKYIDNFVINESEPYLPGNRHLYDSSRISTKLGSGQVIYNTPDANYLYEEKLMVDPFAKVGAFPIRNGKISFKKSDGPIEGFVSRKNVPKIMDPKNRDLHFHGGSMRKGKWFDRMIDDKMDDLLNGVQNIVNGGSK
ncbi:MAG: minor capsid protein [Erysipelotrichaceae bacterium]|nr:minor capsid protein [Erysipelotrichaceae bacterium]